MIDAGGWFYLMVERRRSRDNWTMGTRSGRTWLEGESDWGGAAGRVGGGGISHAAIHEVLLVLFFGTIVRVFIVAVLFVTIIIIIIIVGIVVQGQTMAGTVGRSSAKNLGQMGLGPNGGGRDERGGGETYERGGRRSMGIRVQMGADPDGRDRIEQIERVVEERPGWGGLGGRAQQRPMVVVVEEEGCW